MIHMRRIIMKNRKIAAIIIAMTAVICAGCGQVIRAVTLTVELLPNYSHERAKK